MSLEIHVDSLRTVPSSAFRVSRIIILDIHILIFVKSKAEGKPELIRICAAECELYRERDSVPLSSTYLSGTLDVESFVVDE